MHASSLIRAAVVLATASAGMLLQASCARSVSSEDVSDPGLFSPDAGGVMPQNACIQAVCPKPWATCPGESTLCTTDTSRDVNHCGSCANACPQQTSASHATALCTGGKCSFACKELFADCDHVAVNGCETSTADDPKNCGFCGNTCKDGDLCWRGACGCPSGYTQCGQECKKTDSDNDNCGGCGNLCRTPKDGSDPSWICGPNVTPDNTAFMCATSACSQQCKPGYGDCNKQFCADGCEIDLTSDNANCGACGNACTAGQECVGGSCLCPIGTTRCGDECVDMNVDPRHCGGCGDVCPGPSGRQGGPACVAGECTYICGAGFADCDGDVDNGCEANIGSNPRHCGSCKTACPLGPGQPCVEGKCLSRECDGGVIF